MRCIIVEDEEQAIGLLTKSIAECQLGLEVVDVCNSIEEAEKSLQSLTPDLVFMDIDLKGRQSFELLEGFSTIPFKIIFITGHNDFAIQAFKYAAIDYLLKPYSNEELMVAVNKARQQVELEKRVNILKEQVTHQRFSSKIALPTGKSIEFVKIDDIVFLKADDRYSICKTIQGEKIHVNRMIKEFELMFESRGFYRIHKSYLIHLKHIKSLSNKEIAEVTMDDGSVLPIAHKRKTRFFEYMSSL